jgi:GrpB-like predicted nucleotidyltransferase (UPF0157 family)
VRLGATGFAGVTSDASLAPYSPDAPDLYSVEAARVAAAIPAALAVAHVGSTAVPGLAGKPTIDIAVGVPTLQLEDADFRRMEALGYAYGGDNGLPQHVFRKGEAVPWAYLVHVVEHEGAMWRDYLGFRDHLRAHPGDARAYAALKASLLRGREGWYSGREKEAFIAPIVARSRQRATRQLPR